MPHSRRVSVSLRKYRVKEVLRGTGWVSANESFAAETAGRGKIKSRFLHPDGEEETHCCSFAEAHADRTREKRGEGGEEEAEMK